MAWNGKLGLASTGPETGLVGNYQNGQRGSAGQTFDRSVSFRESAENMMFGSGKANSRIVANSSLEVPALSQCLMLEPISLGDQKYARSSELMRVLSLSTGSGPEENAFAASHLKNSPTRSVDELKRLRATVADTCVQARGRARKLDEHLIKLNSFCETTSSKKQQRNELLTSERPTVKIGLQTNRNSPELATQKVDDLPNNGDLKKRLRTWSADPRAGSRMLRPPLSVTKEPDPLKDSVDSDVPDERMRRLPTAGESMDKIMTRKRSVGAVYSRSVVNDEELKRTMHHKLISESRLQTSDSTHNFRSGAYGGNDLLDHTSSPAGSTIRTNLRSEPEKSAITRDLPTGPHMERATGNLVVKLNTRNDNHPSCPNPTVKGKASRTPRRGSVTAAISNANVPSLPVTLESSKQSPSLDITSTLSEPNPSCPNPIVIGKASRTPRRGSVTAANSNVNVPCVPVTLESSKQSPSLDSTSTVSEPNNRKRAISVVSSHNITQWVGQTTQKSSRTRTDLLTVSNNDETRIRSEGSSPDFGGAINNALLIKGVVSRNHNLKSKPENVSSLPRFSESEKSGVGDNRTKEENVAVDERVISAGQAIGPSVTLTEKNKIVLDEEIDDSARTRRRNGRASPFSRSTVSQTKEKLDIVTPSKLLRSSRNASEKNGSNSGRCLRKLPDRKGVSRLSHVAKGSSPDCNGESEDDHEELLAAANLAHNSSINLCPTVFWKDFESLFASVGPDEKSFLSEQFKLAELSSQTCRNSNDLQENYDCEDIVASKSLSSRRNVNKQNEIRSKDVFSQMDFAEVQNSSLLGCSDTGKGCNIATTPMYQRVLSAFITEDEIEEFDETGFGRQRSSFTNSYLPNETESKHMNMINFCESIFDVQACKDGNGHIIYSCNGNTNFGGTQIAQDGVCYSNSLLRGGAYVHSEGEVLAALSRCVYTNYCGISSLSCQYGQMSPEEKIVVELQSLDLLLETMPKLYDKEDDVIDQNIVRLERELQEQSLKKKACLDKLNKAVQKNNNVQRDPEQAAMDKLVELAYRKLLGTNRSFASKNGIPKVPRQVALAFVRRTLARCREFEYCRASCFSEPTLRDIVHALPRRLEQKELLTACNLAVPSGRPISSSGRRKEVLLDDVGGPMFRTSSALGTSGSAKGKRSERESASTRNASARLNQIGGSKSESKIKSHPVQKATQLSTPAHPSSNGPDKLANNNVSERKDVRFMSSGNSERKDVRFMSSGNSERKDGNSQPVKSKDADETMDLRKLPLDELDDLDVDTDTGAPKDLNSWFDFEVDGLPDHDMVGLEIPMDDLSELKMF